MNPCFRHSIVASIRATSDDVLAVLAANSLSRPSWDIPGCYRETSTRQDMRALLDGAAVNNAVVRLGFLKVGGEMRHMIARPCIGADQTNQFYTVKDLELSLGAGRCVFRRVNLDTIIAAQVEFHAANAR